MVRRERRLLKRSMAQALHNLDRCLGDLKGLRDIFEPVHPEYAQLLDAIAQVLFMGRDLMEKFWLHAWGTLPDDIDVYRK